MTDIYTIATWWWLALAHYYCSSIASSYKLNMNHTLYTYYT